MDLGSLDTSKKSSEGAVMILSHPETLLPLDADKDGKKVEMFIKLLGRDSREFMSASQSINRASLDDGADLELLSAASITVGGLVFMDGKWLEITPKNAVDVYTRCRWIVEQVTTFALDRANFFPDTKTA